MPMFQKQHIRRFISEFAGRWAYIHYRRIEGDRFCFFTNYSVLTEFMDQSFLPFDDCQQAQERGLPMDFWHGNFARYAT